MRLSIRQIERTIGVSAIVAPILHSLTDLVEWTTGGFSDLQLWANYVAFLMMPFVIMGLYAVQLPKIGLVGLVGAVLYGISFIYFSHSTLFALQQGVQDYSALWEVLGSIYTAHGAVMIVGGIGFGVASLRARVLSEWACGLFLVGVLLNFALAILAAPEIFQTLGSVLRNIGLAGMGFSLVFSSARPSPDNE